MSKVHSFHIPVMGIGFTIDTPVKVAHYGIDSVLSLVDDILLEKVRKVYSEKIQVPYNEISDKIDDFRAKRITAYLDLMNDIVDQKFEELKTKTSEVKKYFSMLPDASEIKQEFNKLMKNDIDISDIKQWLNEKLVKGSIDVNIMTKIDKDNYIGKEKLPQEYKDAHAALRGFAKSKISSSLVLSAGMNPRLYSYIEQFDDFYPNEEGEIKKKIVLKVSDYRSALIQGKFFAKKGIWVSEYRIESGLNCGGHAFATEGFLMGPILEGFKKNRQDLEDELNSMIADALVRKNKTVPKNKLKLRVTAQGGVGTHDEHEFLLDYFKVDSVGWGSPFLLVPEVVNIDKQSLKLLQDAKEDDLYLSGISPLGVPFNSVRGNTKDEEKKELIKKGKPGSVCPKQYLISSKEYTEKAICTASYRYQRLKIKELEAKNLPKEEYQKEYDKIVEKSCICVGLGTSVLLNYNLDTSIEGTGVSVCPGPNMAYYSKELKLHEMVDHIYGRTNVITDANRPNMFVKELNVYIDYLKNKINETKESINDKQEKYLHDFTNNLSNGVNYYIDLFSSNLNGKFKDSRVKILNDFKRGKQSLEEIKEQIQAINKRIFA